jgi:divalent metal cation (Fe/Co/Zn/Cd) transporter
VRGIVRRLMDGIDPEIVERAEHALERTSGVLGVPSIRLRWVGHRLQGSATIQVAEMTLTEAENVTHEAQHEFAHELPNLDAFDIATTTKSDSASKPHTH